MTHLREYLQAIPHTLKYVINYKTTKL